MEENQIVVFRLGEETYALDTREVKEIGRMREMVINRVPQVPKYVKGIINLRGDVVPVVDLCDKLGVTSRTTAKKQRMMIVLHQQTLYGLLVDEMIGVKSLEEGVVHLPTEEMSYLEPQISGIIRMADHVIFMLDLGHLMVQT